MSDGKVCDHCGKGYWYTHPHIRFRVLDTEFADEQLEGVPECGNSHEEAAERWAESEDAEGDYTIVGGDYAVVSIWREGDDFRTARKFRVDGEAVPSYSARAI